METKKIDHLTRELKLKKFQFDSIYEFSSSIYSSFDIDSIVRIFFSTLMGQMAISRMFYLDSSHGLFREKGCSFSPEDQRLLRRELADLGQDWFQQTVSRLPSSQVRMKTLLLSKKIQYLVNLSDSGDKRRVLGLGYKMNKIELTAEEIEFSFFIARFALIAIENATLVERIIENKRIEHELKIATDIQLSLLPQELPQLRGFDLAVTYQPINEVGGDYYDILKKHKSRIPLLMADVEGKGLPAALLAASSQAVFHSLNQLYFFSPAQFIAKANQLICDFTRGRRFITLFWMLVEEKSRSITYVNAGHVPPVLIRGERVLSLDTGGYLIGFLSDAVYESDTVEMRSGDILVAFTDGLTEASDSRDEEFGTERLISWVKEHRDMTAAEMAESLFGEIGRFSGEQKWRDDVTLMILKAE